jgi:hypothetical protein
VGGSRSDWYADYWQGGAPGPGVMVEGGHRSKIRLLSRPKYTKTAKKRGVSRTIWLKNRRKCRFFAQKYLTRYTHETFFKEYMNFETHYLSHCRVIPLKSFGSHIRPQPHRLGLTLCLAKKRQNDFSLFTYLQYTPTVDGLSRSRLN